MAPLLWTTNNLGKTHAVTQLTFWTVKKTLARSTEWPTKERKQSISKAATECFQSFSHSSLSLFFSILCAALLNSSDSEGGKQSQKALNSINVQPPRDLQREMTSTSVREWRELESLVQILNHLPCAKVENYRGNLWVTKMSFRRSQQQFKKLVLFWIEWFYLPAQCLT